MNRKKRLEWKRFIEKYELPLVGLENRPELRKDYELGLNYFEVRGEMATKELTTKIIQQLLKLVAIPDDIYNAIKEKQDRIIEERNAYKFKKISEKLIGAETNGKWGYVYFLKEYHGNTVKIGHAKDPLKRLKQMTIIPSVPVELIHTIPSRDAYHLERMFHSYYSKKRIAHGFNTEFFLLTEDDVRDIYCRKLPEEMKNLILQ